MSYILQIDHSLFFAIHNLSGQSRLLDVLGVFLAEYLIYLIGVIVGLYALWRHYTLAGQPWKFLGESVIAAGLARSVKIIFHFFSFRPRPAVTLGVQSLISNFDPVSFPSGHSLIVFALATTMFFYNRRLSYLLFGLALVIGLARVYVGAHFPLDILVGGAVGVLSSFVVEWGSKRLKNIRTRI